MELRAVQSESDRLIKISFRLLVVFSREIRHASHVSVLCFLIICQRTDLKKSVKQRKCLFGLALLEIIQTCQITGDDLSLDRKFLSEKLLAGTDRLILHSRIGRGEKELKLTILCSAEITVERLLKIFDCGRMLTELCLRESLHEVQRPVTVQVDLEQAVTGRYELFKAPVGIVNVRKQTQEFILRLYIGDLFRKAFERFDGILIAALVYSGHGLAVVRVRFSLFTQRADQILTDNGRPLVLQFFPLRELLRHLISAFGDPDV